jgi:hypothetical protein
MTKKAKISRNGAHAKAPGWDAIDAACRRIYRGQEPVHFGTLIKYILGGPDPIDGISIYKNAKPRPHWHYVTYGFTELYRKETPDRKISGFGFELTFRLACREKEKKPPMGPLGLLNNLARYVFTTGRAFTPGQHLDCNSPLALDVKTNLRALLFTRDPQLGGIDTPHGHVDFVQIVGITPDELEVTQEWTSDGLLDVLAHDDPMLVTDLKRKSLLADPVKAKIIHERTAKEGSSCGVIYNDSTRWHVSEARSGNRLELTLGAKIVQRFVRLLRGRILHDRDFALQSEHGLAVFKPARRASWRARRDNEILIGVTPDLVHEIEATLRPDRGKYACPSLENVTFKVVPTKIKDQDGKVVEVIG